MCKQSRARVCGSDAVRPSRWGRDGADKEMTLRIRSHSRIGDVQIGGRRSAMRNWHQIKRGGPLEGREQ